MASDGRRLVKRIGVGLLSIAGLAFAVQGGEFGTLDLLRQQREKAALTRTIDSLHHVVDSLARYEKALETDPATQERVAREMFGMVRGDKELLYRFVDSTGGSKSR